MELSTIIAVASGIGTAVGTTIAAYRKRKPIEVTTKEDIEKKRALQIEHYVQGEKVDRIFQALLDLKDSIATIEESRETVLKVFDVVEHLMRREDHRFKITVAQINRIQRAIDRLGEK